MNYTMNVVVYRRKIRWTLILMRVLYSILKLIFAILRIVRELG